MWSNLMTETQQPPFDPLGSVAWPVRTARLLLRRAEPRDAETTWTFRQLPEFAQWQSGAPATFAAYAAQFEQPGSLAKTLVVELGGTVIGDLMISVQDAWAQDEVKEQARGVQADLGCGLHPAHNGHGYATEALGEVLRLCFDELQLRRVTADCFADNTASRRLMERVGMRREAYTVRDCLHRSGAWLDGTAYALLQEEWAACE
jgi:RimJ/RimL family protein N-acetyltransferase